MADRSILMATVAGSIVAISLFVFFVLSPSTSTTTKETTTTTNNTGATTPTNDNPHVKEFRNPTDFDKDSLQAYIEKKSSELKMLSSGHPDKEIWGAVSFKRPLTQAEIDEIVVEHDLKIEAFEYVATNNVPGGPSPIVGGASTILYPNLDKLQESLTYATLIGITYIFGNGTASEFEKLNQNSDDVILADIGYFLQIEEVNKQGGIAGQNMPANLYTIHKSLNLVTTELQQ